VKAAFDMLDVFVRPLLLCVSYGASVVTVNGHVVQRAWNHSVTPLFSLNLFRV
jgi:hypothetical protein